MLFRFVFMTLFAFLADSASAYSFEFHNIQLESQIEALFAGNRDMAEIELTIDRMVDPSVDVAANLKIIDRMAADIERMRAEAGATSDFDKLAVLRRYIYQSGPWNGERVFSYDLDDPFGKGGRNRLLSDYLADRQGNCVSMPILLMILSNRMGLKTTLAQAPMHYLVKLTDSDGNQWNLEATSGAGFTRESYYRKRMPEMTDAAIANGLFLRGLTRDETIVVMASGIVTHLTDTGRLEDAAAVSDRLLSHAPNFLHTKLTRADVLGHLFNRDVVDRYKFARNIPPDARAYADELYQQNVAAFAEAEALGWRESKEKF